MVTLARFAIRSLLSLALLCANGAASYAIETIDDAAIDALFEDWAGPDKPGGVVGIFEYGEPLYLQAFGAANLEHFAPINLDTRFNIASMAKTFTAFGILLLDDAGALSLSDDIRQHLPELSDFPEIITIDDLLYHSSGLRNWSTLYALTGVSEDDVVDRSDILNLIFKQKELNHRPGDRASYSNTNYVLLSLIIERVSGQAFREFAQEHIFAPLGMDSTFFADDINELISNRASGHSVAGPGTFKLDSPLHNSVGDSNLQTTMHDFSLWEAHLHDPKLGSPGLIAALFQRGEFNSGETSAYSRGLGIGSFRGLTIRGMAGGEPGFRSSHTQFPDSGVSVVIFANADYDINTYFAQVVALLFEAEIAAAESQSLADEKEFLSITAADLEAFAGPYLGEDSVELFSVYADTADGALLISGPGYFERVKASAPLRFESVATGGSVQIIFDSNTDSLHYSRAGVFVFRGSKLRTVLPDAAYYQQFVGSYYSGELDSTFDIVLREDGLYRTKVGLPDRKLSSQYVDMFEAEGGTGTLLFVRDSANDVTGFKISVANVHNLHYEKMERSTP